MTQHRPSTDPHSPGGPEVTDPKEDLAASQGHAPALPPLPEPHGFSVGHLFADNRSTAKNYAKGARTPYAEFYTADQMRAYSALVLEEAARVCEAQHEEDRPGDYACAIRALKPK
jgi:hypothetical protein